MKKRHWFSIFGCCFAAIFSLSGAVSNKNDIQKTLYAKNTQVEIVSSTDHVLAKFWKKKNLPLPMEAADHVMVRRLYLDLTGRLPTVDEAKKYCASQDPKKQSRLAAKLVYSSEFARFWTMRFCDILRVKSEFPINLWPNAVYAYERRIYDFLSRKESCDDFFYSLLTASGSNFRVAEVNFYRAGANKTPEGIAQNVMLTLFGIRFEELSKVKQKEIAEFFSGVRFKATKEWKEEIVFHDYLPERVLTLPNGSTVTIPAGADSRKYFAEYAVYGKGKKLMAEAMVNRVWFWIFGKGLAETPDALNRKQSIPREIQRVLSGNFLRRKCSFQRLCLDIVTTAAYRAASIQHDQTAMSKAFAAYPVRRLEAEVLSDAIRDLTGTPWKYSSVIPEPFTYLPPEMRTIQIADGSINDSFLILFGRPARDSGFLAERKNNITAKQRLFLFNSGSIFRKLSRIAAYHQLRKMSVKEQIDTLYWLFYSRPPTAAEKSIIMKKYKEYPDRKKWNFYQDIAWILVNSAEFLHQH